MHVKFTPRLMVAAAFAVSALAAGCSSETAPKPPGGLFLPGSPAAATSTPTAVATASATSGATSAASAGPSASASAGATAAATGSATATPAASSSPVPTSMPTSTGTTAPSGGSSPTFTTSGNTNCTAPSLTAGTYYDDITSTGNVSGSTFTGASGSYELVSLVPATPAPSPSPLPSFTPIPVPSTTPGPTATINPTTVYVGEFTTTSGAHPTSGCFDLIATVNGSPITPGVNYNGGAIGTINFDDTMFTENFVNTGTVTSLQVGGLTPTSGSGSFLLDDGTTGSISITGSTTVSSFLRHLPENRAAIVRHRLGL